MKHTTLPFRTLTLLVVLSSAVFLVGCDDDSGSVDAGALDGARYDSDVSNSDSGVVLEWSDAGVDLDAGPLEWERDGGDAAPDGGTTDDAAADSGVRPGDSGATDSGVRPGDSGATDSGAADTGRDAATVEMDSGLPDSGVDAATPECVRDSQCDDMIFCNGVERCSSQGMCTVGAPPECADTDACTIDSCSTTLDQCVHLPRACDLQNAVAACTQGACKPTECSDGYADCNAVASDGCEVALDTDSNCGSCGNVCFTECQNKRCRPGRTGEPCGRDSDCESGDCRARQCVVAPSARLSATDSTRSTVVRSDGLTVEMRNYLGEFGGVRSETAIAPGQGVFYFEVSRLSIEAAYGFGVMTGNAEFSYQIGQTDQSFGFTANRAAIYDNTPDFLGSPTPAVGFVIDYRGSSPVIYALLERFGTPDVYVRAMPNVTTPLYAAFMGLIPEHGPLVEFNFGNDTTNHPFYFDPDSLLRSAGSADVANALVLGFGQTRARAFSNPPTLNLSQTMLTVPVGTPVMVTGSATDVEDGDLTASIRWELESDSYYLRRSSTGSSFSFTPEELGIYPVVVRVTDSFGVELRVESW